MCVDYVLTGLSVKVISTAKEISNDNDFPDSDAQFFVHITNVL